MPTPYLSVILPAYNEEANINSGVLADLIGYLKTQKFTWEVIVVNDGSTDATQSLLLGLFQKTRGIKLVNNPHLGKAASIITGAQNSSGQIVLFTDMDQSTPISELEKFMGRFNSGFDVVIGSRTKREGAPLFRQVLAYGMVFLRTLILQLPFRDTQCGFKAFTQKSARAIFPVLARVHPLKIIDYPTTNPGFDLEILYLARKLGFKIAQVPVAWHYRASRRVSFIKDAVGGFKELLLVRYRSLTNQYS